MGNGDKLFGSLPKGLAEEPGDAVLGDDVVGEPPGNGYAGPGLMLGNNARNYACHGRRAEAGDGLASLGGYRSHVKLRLSPGTGYVAPAEDGLGVDLSREIDGEGAVDAYHVVVLGYIGDVDHIVGVVKLDERVVVGIPDLFFRAGGKGR